MLAQEQISGDDIDLICFIFTDTHSIFNYRISANGPTLPHKLAKRRYPESEADAKSDAEFLEGLCENKVAFFSQQFAHLALGL